MISMRSFMTRNAFYLLSVLLLTIITLQIVMTPQLSAHEAGKKRVRLRCRCSLLKRVQVQLRPN